MLNLPKEPDKFLAECEKNKNWYPLIPYPSLLFTYQHKHQDSVKDIARLSSHRLGKHIFCETDEVCNQVEEIYQKYKIPTAS